MTTRADGRRPDELREVKITRGWLAQAEGFSREVGVTGIVLTKLDGTAKGGVALAVADRLGVPIVFAGVGETVEDLAPFDPEAFVEWLFAE